MRAALAALAVVLAVILPACNRGDRVVAVKLDGSPRYADDEGVLTAATFQRVTLDGKRTYKVSRDLRSFSTYTRQLEPMLSRKGQYVQVGLDGDMMVWMAGLAAVVRSTPPAVYYNGRLDRVDGRQAIFEDGTVLRLAGGVKAPPEVALVRARIDPGRHQVVELTAAR